MHIDALLVVALLAAPSLQDGDSPLPAAPLFDPTAAGRWVRLDDGALSFVGRAVIADVAPADAAQAVSYASAFVNAALGKNLTSSQLDARQVEELGNDTYAVRLEQRIGGVPVQDAEAAILVVGTAITFARTRLAELRESPSNTVSIADEAARALAAAHFSKAAVSTARPEPRLVLLGADALRFAWRVEVDTQRPFAWWAVFVDAESGAIARADKLSGEAVSGDVAFQVDTLCMGQGTSVVGMPHIAWNGGSFADDAGHFYSASDVAQASVQLASPYFRLNNQAGALAGPWSFPLAAEPAVNSLEITSAPLDQVTPFFHIHKVRGWLRGRLDHDNSQKAWTEEKVDVNVNLNSTCNAFYNGTINFFQAGNGCLNTGRVAAIVYHEYGHGIHHHSGGSFDGQVSEGISDYIAATITNQPGIGGLQSCGSFFRHCENDYTYCSSGCDFGPGSPVHSSGQVICAVWWGFRKQLVAMYGYDLGIATADRIFLRYLSLVGNMSSSYDAAIAADDDEDGDPSNGTRHSCELNRAFADDSDGAVAHFPELQGKIPSAPSVTIKHEPPGRVSLAAGAAPQLEFVIQQTQGCAPAQSLAEVTLHYRVPGGAAQSVVAVASGATADGERFVASLEGLSAPVTIEYYLTAKLANIEFIYPYQGPRVPRDNKYPYYRQMARFADDLEIYSSDFESDDGGLTASTTSADAQPDWEWGKPNGLGGDPTAAVSGEKIWGTDLGEGGDGQYSRQRTSYLELPAFDASGHSEVRLQFWRYLLNSDVARIEVNGRRVYEHRAGGFFWRDPAWTFQDLDISPFAAGQSNVRIRFVMVDEFPDSFELGGWNIDNLAVVAAGTQGGTTVGGSDMPDGLSFESSGCAAAGAADGALAILALGLLVMARAARRPAKAPSRAP